MIQSDSMVYKPNCILFIDDELATNLMNKAFLEEGYFCNHIIKRPSGLPALKYLSQSVKINDDKKLFPELIFPGIAMPRLSGWYFKIYKSIITVLPFKSIIFLQYAELKRYLQVT